MKQQPHLVANTDILLQRKAKEIVHAPALRLGFYSPIFLILKKDSDDEDDSQSLPVQSVPVGALHCSGP